MVGCAHEQNDSGLPIKHGGNVILRTQGLCKSFDGQAVLVNVSLTLNQGEVVLLCGDNGCGKTTLLNVLTGNLRPDSGTIELCVNRIDRHSFPLRTLRRWYTHRSLTPERMVMAGIGRTWQGVRLFPTLHLRDNISVASPHQIGENVVWTVLRRFASARQEREIHRSADERLARLHLQGREESYADQISLGQSKRVAIARALNAGTEVLLLDEPLAGLDKQATQDVIDVLNTVATAHGTTLVIVEHPLNIPKLLNMVTTVWTLRSGTVVASSPDEAGHQLRHFYGGMPQGLPGKTPQKVRHVAQQRLADGVSWTTFSEPCIEPRSVVLDVDDLVVYRGRRLVIGQRGHDGSVRGVSLQLRSGQIGVIEAPNGWGKTTLLEALSGLQPISNGSIQLNGRPIGALPPWERARLGLSFLQYCSGSFSSLTVREVFRLSRLDNIPHPLSHLANMRLSSLSGGERQKVLLACIHQRPSSVLMFDEPLSGLDHRGIRDFWTALECHTNTAVLLAVPSG